MKGQERFRVELGRLQDYCQEAIQIFGDEEDSINKIQEVCSNLRSFMGRLFAIAEELNEKSRKGVTYSEGEASESNTLFDCIKSFRRRNVYYDLLNFEEAVYELRRVVDESTDPHVIASAYNGLGHIYAIRKMYAPAIYYFNKVVEFYPGNSDGYFNLGAVYFNLGFYDEARYYFQQAIYHHTDDWEAYFHLGRTFEKLGELDTAVYYIQKAREIKYSQPAVVMVTR
ncbi:hypothetical protein BBF96_03220 [Anoxybacter fermentans]|uniref:Uncharacterized protein n=1 Tax=Anoxybacter fermentans TaxID=1323375 RepID=A0A3Q9HP41_9FIRM|nr:tetratricopeptide repeat protein [Anoxybacter fermentans]AZR72478.1 hypothetical protein BBF96_03220 [Anoxybacter fermentans]